MQIVANNSIKLSNKKKIEFIVKTISYSNFLNDKNIIANTEIKFTLILISLFDYTILYILHRRPDFVDIALKNSHCTLYFLSQQTFLNRAHIVPPGLLFPVERKVQCKIHANFEGREVIEQVVWEICLNKIKYRYRIYPVVLIVVNKHL